MPKRKYAEVGNCDKKLCELIILDGNCIPKNCKVVHKKFYCSSTRKSKRHRHEDHLLKAGSDALITEDEYCVKNHLLPELEVLECDRTKITFYFYVITDDENQFNIHLIRIDLVEQLINQLKAKYADSLIC